MKSQLQFLSFYQEQKLIKMKILELEDHMYGNKTKYFYDINQVAW